MKRFADLYVALDETNKTNAKIQAMTDYFTAASPADAAWAIYFLSGRKPRQIIPNKKLVMWAIEQSAIDEWLFSESYDAVGDMAETITLLLPEANQDSDLSLREWVEDKLLPLRTADEKTQYEAVLGAWRDLSTRQRFIYNKLISGAFRVGVSQQLVTRALANVSGLEVAILAHRLMGTWEPTDDFYTGLIATEVTVYDVSRPYPFCLAYAIKEPQLRSLGDIHEWQTEWKWDGIRAQIIRRQNELYIWTRGEELVTDRYPEVAEAALSLPDGTVIDGELLPWSEGKVMPFAQLQRRIGRKTLTKKMLAEVPVIFLAYDVLEHENIDVRDLPQEDRRSRLESFIHPTETSPLQLSPIVTADSWENLAHQRQ